MENFVDSFSFTIIIIIIIIIIVGSESVFGIATRYGSNGSGIESLPISVAERSKAKVCGLAVAGIAGTGPGAHPFFYKMGTGFLVRK